MTPQTATGSTSKKRLPPALLATPLATIGLITWIALHPPARSTDFAKDPRAIALDQEEQQALENGVNMAADYIVRQCNAEGKFAYRIYINGQHDSSQEYNVVRHAGAMHALGMVEKWHPTPGVRQALLRSSKFLNNFIGPAGSNQEMLTVWSKPRSESSQARTGVLGGTGLGLVALLSVEDAHPGTIPLKELERLGAFILFMQKSDGSFYSRYSVPGGRSDQFKSLYYPGEAALALAMLYERDPQPRWLEGAAKGLTHLARERKGQKKVPPDHWALIATQFVLKHLRDEPNIANSEELIAHGIQICDSILIADANSGPIAPVGSLTSNGRTTPTATRLEGLLAALDFIPEKEATLRSRLEVVTRQGVDFLLAAQVKSGPYRGGVVGEMASSSGGAVTYSQIEIRIDYVQHALCAMLGYLQRTG